MDYETAKANKRELESMVARASAILQKFPRGKMGLVSDETAATPEYQSARTSYAYAFDLLRKFNAAFVRQWSAELRLERSARRKA